MSPSCASTPEMGRVYDLQAWKRARREHLAHEPLCVMCRKLGRTVPATEVDHIIPISKGGEWFYDNLQSLCESHHSQKTRRDEGKTVRMGAGIDGTPLDPAHPWNAGG